MKLTKDEAQAAQDALYRILGQEKDEWLSKEFKDAWNKIMQTYGTKNFEKYTKADLEKILQDLKKDKLNLDPIDLTNKEAKSGASGALQALIDAKDPQTPPQNIIIDGGDPIGDGDDFGDNTDIDLGLILPPNIVDIPAKASTITKMDGIIDTSSDDLPNRGKILQGIKDDEEEKKEKAEKEKKDAFDELTKKNKELNGGNYEDFVHDLKLAIGQQIKEIERAEDTYNRGPNPSLAGTGYILPKEQRLTKLDIPTIYVFFDVSGSCKDAIPLGVAALKELATLVSRKKIKKPVLKYFANRLGDEQYGIGSGTSGFPWVMKYIQDSFSKGSNDQVKNVIVFSDSDIERQTGWDLPFEASNGYAHGWDIPLKVKGHVFWCWINGSKSPKAMRYLKGDKGSTMYNIQ